MIVGYEKLKARLEDFSHVNMKPAVAKSIEFVQACAKENCGGFRQSTGELRDSIYVRVSGDENRATGTCYTNKEYAAYVEFGTGPVGQENHAGISPDVTCAWSQTGWMIPGKAMDREKAEGYGLGVVEGKDGKPIGYLTNGQPAHPFMYPALNDHRKDIDTIFEKELKRQL